MKRQRINLFFENKNVNILDKPLNVKEKLEYDDVIRQIQCIIYFHKQFNGYRENLNPRIGSTIGKDIENYKLQVKILSREINLLQKKDNITSLDNLILNDGSKIIKKCNQVINDIQECGYHDLIKRAMINYEICLNKVDERNLSLLENGKLNIGTIQYITYNLIEHDFYNYIKKVKGKVGIDNIDNLVGIYTENLSLDNRSEKYIKALLNFPNESFKVLNKFRNGKRYECDEQCIDALKIAMGIDNII